MNDIVNNKNAKKIINTILLCCVLCIIVCSDITTKEAMAKSKGCINKNIKLETRATYKLKYKRTYRYKCSNNAVAIVTKKGKVKTKRSGNCVVKVYNNKKCIIKYHILVRAISGKYSDNVLIGNKTRTLENIEQVDDNNIFLYFNTSEWNNEWLVGNGKLSDYKYMKIHIDKATERYKDMEFIVGNKYKVNVAGSFTEDGESALIDGAYCENVTE